MKRRLVLTVAAASAMPIGSEAFAAGTPTFGLTSLTAVVDQARHDLEASRLTTLAEAIPELLAAGEVTVESAAGPDRSVASGLFSRLLAVAGHVAYRTSNETDAAAFAARARVLAEEAADPIAACEAERVAAVVVRRSGDPAATGLMMAAADRLEHTTGLTEPVAASTWAETASSTAYTAAGFGALDDADELLDAARARLETVTRPTRFTVNDVHVFAMSAAMNAGAFDLVLARSRRVNPGLLTTRHQRSHFHKDVAIAAAACGNHDRAVAALERIDVVSPDFLAYRPWARHLARDLADSAAGARSPVVQHLSR